MSQNVLSIDLQLQDLKGQYSHSPIEMRARIESILHSAESINYSHGIAEAKLYLAQLLWADMSFAHANRIIKPVIQFAKADGAKNLLAEAYHLSALIYVAKGQYTLALAQWLKCLKLMQTVQHPSLAVDMMIGLGNLWAIDQQNEKALLELSQAFDLAQSIQSPAHAAKAAICLSRERLRLGHLEEALASLEQGARHLGALNNPTWFAEICNYRARACLALHQADQADAECQIAWQMIADDAHLVWAQCLTLITRAQVALAQQQNPLPNLNQANALANQYQLHTFQSQIALIRAQYAEQQAQWDEALASFKHYRQLDLGELAQQQQHGAREFSSVEFLRLVQQIEVQRKKSPPLLAQTTQTTHLPHNYLPRYLWLQQLIEQLNSEPELGVVFIRLPADHPRFPAQRTLYLMASICRENSLFCQYAAGLFAILIPQTSEIELNQYQRTISGILRLLPLATQQIAVAAAQKQTGDSLTQLLSRVETQLYPVEH